MFLLGVKEETGYKPPHNDSMFIFSSFKIKQKLNCQLIFQLFCFRFPSWHSSINGKWAYHAFIQFWHTIYSYILFLACRIWMSFRIIMLWAWELFQIVSWKVVGGQKAKSNWIIAKQWIQQRNEMNYIIMYVNALSIHHPPLRIVWNKLMIALGIFTSFSFSFSKPYRRQREKVKMNIFPKNITHRL